VTLDRVFSAARAIAQSCLIVCAVSSCQTFSRTDGLDVARIPTEHQAEYNLFADRCSRCHSLARPLNAGITREAEWRNYVRRMRRQPSSGISPEDEAPLVRFLVWYSANRQAASGGEL
jgi:hypothetical protein